MKKYISWISDKRKKSVKLNSQVHDLKPQNTEDVQNNISTQPSHSSTTSNNTGNDIGGDLNVHGNNYVTINNNRAPTIQDQGALITQFSVISPSKHFTGRQGLLQKIDDMINQLKTGSNIWEDKIGVIYGLGGVGKTELVRAYVSRGCSRNDLKHVLVINGTNYRTAKRSFQDLAVSIFGSTVDNYRKRRVIVPEIYKYFAGKTDDVTLFIFENVTELKGEHAGILEFLPRMLIDSKYKIPLVLLISRHDDWNNFPKLCISELDENEAKAYLLSRFQQIHSKSPMLENQDHQIRTLANKLQRYPLGLTIAISNILNDIFNKTLTAKIENYLNQKEQDHEEWLMQELSGTATTDYTLTMDTVFNADIEKVQSIDKDGKKALHLLHLVSDPGSEQLVRDNREDAVKNFFEQLKLKPGSQALRALFNYSIFVKSKGLSCQIHEIIQLCESKWRGEYLRSKLEITS